jgi:hypothetical protein
MCQWFTYLFESSGCVLFKDCIELNTYDCDNCVSGQVDCDPIQPKCDVVGQCLGIVDLISQVESKNACLKRCQDSANCTWYTFESQTNLCEEFYTCPLLDENCSTCISGESECQIKEGGI